MKRLLSVLLVACMCCGLLVGCGGDSKPEGKSESGSTKEQRIGKYSYEVPEDWEEGENTDVMQYFYPTDGMLMVGYSEMDQSIADDLAREDFINSFSASMDAFELNSEEKIQVAGTEGYRHEMNLGMADEDWKASMVTFDCDGGVITFMMSILKDSEQNYDEAFEAILKSIELVSGAVSDGKSESAEPDAETVRKQVDARVLPTADGLMCVFITNNSDAVIDELSVQINYKDEGGTTVDMDEDWHDMVLPGSTVVSRMDAPDNYVDYEIETSVELGAHPKYENHASDVVINSNQGDKCVIVEITNNSDVLIDEIEYIAVLYKGDEIVTVKYPQDVMDVESGQTVTEKVETYSEDYDRFEIYLNQAHTFGL